MAAFGAAALAHSMSIATSSSVVSFRSPGSVQLLVRWAGQDESG
jgi:hypothetical protein